MKIAQVTDIHIDRGGESSFGVDVRKNFRSVLEKLNSYSYDYFVLSGDLCFRHADKQIYDWVQSEIQASVISPYYVISGNHDLASIVADSFGLSQDLHNGELYYQRKFGKHKVLFLDTTPGYSSKKQKDWLIRQMRQINDDAMIFMHHPPVFGGVPHMDNQYALEDREEFMDIFSNHAHNVYVFCGHFHVDKIVSVGNVHVHITPSCFVQIDQRFEKFTADHFRSGFRMIEWEGDYLSSTVHYVDES